MKIFVTVSKTIQERQYEPTTCSVTWMHNSDMSIAEEETQATYVKLSQLVDDLLYIRTGKKVRRS
jgi:hypothetical protein